MSETPEIRESQADSSSNRARPVADEEWQAFANNCVVALPAGGAGERMSGVTDLHQAHKTAILLPGGDTMIQRTVRMYCAAGFREFVALVRHRAESVTKLLGDGSDLGVTVRYSHDPDRGVGRGGAIRNALENGSIPAAKSLIVHNPDDQIVNYRSARLRTGPSASSGSGLPGVGQQADSFPRDIGRAHLEGQRRGHVATVVVVDGMPYAYTGMSIDEDVVQRVRMYPHIPIPTHIGVTVFAPDVYPYFSRLFDMQRPLDFESVLLPVLAEERRLYSVTIPGECWVPVNDPKSLQQLVNILDQDGQDT